jgi:hypothetical protein
MVIREIITAEVLCAAYMRHVIGWIVETISITALTSRCLEGTRSREADSTSRLRRCTISRACFQR